MKLRKDRREQRRREAVERNQRWSELTPLEQLQELNEREVTAARQRAKIQAQLDGFASRSEMRRVTRQRKETR